MPRPVGAADGRLRCCVTAKTTPALMTLDATAVATSQRLPERGWGRGALAAVSLCRCGGCVASGSCLAVGLALRRCSLSAASARAPPGSGKVCGGAAESAPLRCGRRPISVRADASTRASPGVTRAFTAVSIGGKVWSAWSAAVANGSHTARICWAEAGRAWGSFASAASMRFAIDGGTSGRNWVSGGGCSTKCMRINSPRCFAANGRRPVKVS